MTWRPIARRTVRSAISDRVWEDGMVRTRTKTRTRTRAAVRMVRRGTEAPWRKEVRTRTTLRLPSIEEPQNQTLPTSSSSRVGGGRKPTPTHLRTSHHPRGRKKKMNSSFVAREHLPTHALPILWSFSLLSLSSRPRKPRILTAQMQKFVSRPPNADGRAGEGHSAGIKTAQWPTWYYRTVCMYCMDTIRYGTMR
jgi:hypothetical protein